MQYAKAEDEDVKVAAWTKNISDLCKVLENNPNEVDEKILPRDESLDWTNSGCARRHMPVPRVAATQLETQQLMFKGYHEQGCVCLKSASIGHVLSQWAVR